MPKSAKLDHILSSINFRMSFLRGFIEKRLIDRWIPRQSHQRSVLETLCTRRKNPIINFSRSEFPADVSTKETYSGSFLSVDRLSLQHLVYQCIIFHRSPLLINPQETQSLKSRRLSFPSLLNEFTTLSFGGISENPIMRRTHQSRNRKVR